MSLARTLMSGSVMGLNNPNKYGHENGASTIAIESVEELHEIFLESYNYEQAELAAASEGIVLEGSQYEAVAEAAVKNALTKIKDFFAKLWEKVKAFFHNIKRYIDSLFMSGKEFVKKYKADIDAVKTIKDLTVSMYKYNDDSINTYKVDDMKSALKDAKIGNMDVLNVLSSDVIDMITAVSSSIDKIDGKDAQNMSYAFLKNISSQSEKIDKYIEDLEDLESEELQTKLFATFRNGAEDDSDKEDVEITPSMVKEMATNLSKTDMSKLDSLQTAVSKSYKTSIDQINKLADKMDKMETDNMNPAKKQVFNPAVSAIRKTSTLMSKTQNIVNTSINAWKTAAKERDAVYKRVILAAISNNKKNSK